jgi:hypothetical protein
LKKWVDIESDASVQEDIIEEAMDEFDMKNFTEESAELSDNDDPMDEDSNSVMEGGKEGTLASVSWKLQTISRHSNALAN